MRMGPCVSAALSSATGLIGWTWWVGSTGHGHRGGTCGQSGLWGLKDQGQVGKYGRKVLTETLCRAQGPEEVCLAERTGSGCEEEKMCTMVPGEVYYGRGSWCAGIWKGMC